MMDGGALKNYCRGKAVCHEKCTNQGCKPFLLKATNWPETFCGLMDVTKACLMLLFSWRMSKSATAVGERRAADIGRCPCSVMVPELATFKACKIQRRQLLPQKSRRLVPVTSSCSCCCCCCSCVGGISFCRYCFAESSEVPAVALETLHAVAKLLVQEASWDKTSVQEFEDLLMTSTLWLCLVMVVSFCVCGMAPRTVIRTDLVHGVADTFAK